MVRAATGCALLRGMAAGAALWSVAAGAMWIAGLPSDPALARWIGIGAAAGALTTAVGTVVQGVLTLSPTDPALAAGRMLAGVLAHFALLAGGVLAAVLIMAAAEVKFAAVAAFCLAFAATATVIHLVSVWSMSRSLQRRSKPAAPHDEKAR